MWNCVPGFARFFFVSTVCVLIMNSSDIYTVTEISETTQ